MKKPRCLSTLELRRTYVCERPKGHQGKHLETGSVGLYVYHMWWGVVNR